jgi:hypothetical protein
LKARFAWGVADGYYPEVKEHPRWFEMSVGKTFLDARVTKEELLQWAVETALQHAGEASEEIARLREERQKKKGKRRSKWEIDQLIERQEVKLRKNQAALDEIAEIAKREGIWISFILE